MSEESGVYQAGHGKFEPIRSPKHIKQIVPGGGWYAHYEGARRVDRSRPVAVWGLREDGTIDAFVCFGGPHELVPASEISGFLGYQPYPA